MKKVIFIIALFNLAHPASAAQTNVTANTLWGINRSQINSNFTELYFLSPECIANQHRVRGNSAWVCVDLNYEPAKAISDHYVTSADLTTLANTSGVNTGDQAIDWNATEGLAYIANKPALLTLGTIAGTALDASDVRLHYPGSDNQTNISGSAGSLNSAYIDWNATTGGAVVQNKPTLGTASTQDVEYFATAAQGAKADASYPVGVPTTPTTACTANSWSYDLSYLYICVATDTWLRTPLAW